MMIRKYRQCGALQFGIFTKLIHQHRDIIRDGEINEVYAQNITTQISL